MYSHNLPKRPVPTMSLTRFAARCAVTLALLPAACNDGASRINAPVQFSNSSAGPAAASNFAVLANAAATCTDAIIIGDVGTFQAPPTGSFTQTRCGVTGTAHVGDAAAQQAFNAFLAAYAALAPQAGDACTTLTGTLAGVTLAPGVYCFDAAATLTGVLTLDGPSNATWTFKVGTSGTGALTGTNFSVVMAGGGQACNVTWWVAQAATMTTSNFQGNILAGAGIEVTGGSFNGNAWSKADVTLTGGSLIGCAGTTPTDPGDGDGDGHGKDKEKCNQGVGNGPEMCDPGNSNHHNPSNDENGGKPGSPGRKKGK
jgi:hypothetical protein